MTVGRSATLAWLFRAVIALNFVRFTLSFFPWFEGTERRAGMVDRLLGSYTVGFFRADFAWLFASSLIIFPATFYFAKISTNDPGARLDVVLGWAWTVAFVIYVMRSILTGVLYPG